MTGPLAAPFSSLIVAPDDLAAAQALALPVALIVAEDEGGETTFRAANTPLSAEDAMLRALGVLPLSASGRDCLTRVQALWRARFDLPLAEAVATDRAELLSWVIVRLDDGQRQGAARATRLMRELSVLRQQHDTTQTCFRDLEDFVHHNGPQPRTLAMTLSPLSGQRPIPLMGGEELIQRLPGRSSGLSDIALHLAEVPARPGGVLTLSLQSPDTHDTLAIWSVPAARLQRGWLRFALDRALGPDPVGLMIAVGYQGEGHIALSVALHHPDPRFHGRLRDRRLETIPALRLWRWVAGVSAPVAVDAVLPVGGQSRLRRVDPAHLMTALDLGTFAPLPPVEGGEALLVHVLPDTAACGLLTGAALPGMSHAFAGIQTRHPDAPPVEYRMCLAPARLRPRSPGRLPEIAPGHCSGWVCLAPQEAGQLHILPPAPLEEAHDIYLMTRLPAGQTSNAFGWSTFADIGLLH
ncbi:DUF6212 domain-containing protein [Falsirhodobacter algicola]|uniref:Uncharacterized protein n=1 Tax=Falsirhodobacter algicola TaxID=2692330 RepID=A0A8J8MTX9_9RHOB|nr:DUF6212 domain-containing protein [Falsirhodobacter algicola]QUS36183.1 hypothetical protein GR316_07815 [Falsirhodobacter algicola]